ncbi:hypothetical protein MARA_48320 [Mycolicibacterium arabiense]|uniref:DUF218 domain-containing protein n=1 Tax=Mycolicibacterium arabiense TaxID=1286181 RepID=A0A7I7S393_9MYCO|nr:YdcF family protein [Mycolicibacterium arabiense]BBY51364.1 hypothetical protein MARA_48320 [Mycolicibacterium arabiense]
MRPLRRSRLAASIFAVVAALIVAGFPVYVRPQVDPVRKADAILVLGGPSYGRYARGFELGSRGEAPTVVVSNPNGRKDPWLTQQCASAHAFEIVCFVPDPPTTRGEGRELRRLAAERGWRTVVVVTFRPHVSRARFILHRCFDGELVMVEPDDPVPARRWVVEYALQTVGYVRAALQPGC